MASTSSAGSNPSPMPGLHLGQLPAVRLLRLSPRSASPLPFLTGPPCLTGRHLPPLVPRRAGALIIHQPLPGPIRSLGSLARGAPAGIVMLGLVLLARAVLVQIQLGPVEVLVPAPVLLPARHARVEAALQQGGQLDLDVSVLRLFGHHPQPALGRLLPAFCFF